MEALRRDAARNRERIMAAAREAADRGEALSLNAVARSADVGVGTVYRHFSSVDELEEVVVWGRFDELGQLLREPGPARFDRVLTAHIELLVADPLFERVTARAQAALPETSEKRTVLVSLLDEVLGEAQSRGEVREGIDAASVLLLACGAAHSIRSADLTRDSAAATAIREVILRGLRP